MHLFDNHNHSQFSFDGGRTSVEASARAAAAAGLKGICFSDHCDHYVPPMKASFEDLKPEHFDVPQQQAEIDRVQGLLGDNIKILKGIEIGMYEECREDIRKVLSENSFDQVLASVHYIQQTDPYYGGYYDDKDWKQAYGTYLETIYREMTWLAEGHRGRIVELDRDALLRYREMGGEIISLGSDSHEPSRVGTGFPHFAGLLKSLGFRWTAHYESRKLIQLPL